MAGAPPRSEDQVTLANWREAPFSRWAFQHVRELIPTAAVAGGGDDIWALEEARQDLAALAVPREDGAAMTLAEALAASETDGFLVLHRGRIVFEDYRRGMTPASPHILFSVTKSVTGILAGILVGRGQLDPEAPVADYLPEVAGSAYEGAAVRHLLDMTTGIAFVEDYLATEGPIIEYRRASSWNPLAPGETPGDLRSFLAGLAGRIRPHGEVFRYLSPNSDLLGWVIERAAGRRFAPRAGSRRPCAISGAWGSSCCRAVRVAARPSCRPPGLPTSGGTATRRSGPPAIWPRPSPAGRCATAINGTSWARARRPIWGSASTGRCSSSTRAASSLRSSSPLSPSRSATPRTAWRSTPAWRSARPCRGDGH
jgi:hypothetical protein